MICGSIHASVTFSESKEVAKCHQKAMIAQIEANWMRPTGNHQANRKSNIVNKIVNIEGLLKILPETVRLPFFRIFVQ